MSAIGAIFSDEEAQPAQFEAMLTSLSQVPHDDKGTWFSGRIGLAACALHTNADSREQAQPCESPSGQLAAVFDGYLLNHEELSVDLAARGVRLRNRSDVEIALRAYEEWGEDCADRLQGEFSLIIADCRAGKLFAARDHMGLVPLYYREEGGGLIIASDFRTIAALSKTPLQPNHRYLAQIMTNRWYLREDTPWRDVKRLVRAHTLTFDGSRQSKNRYWTPPTDITIRYKSDEEYAEHYRELLFDCVRRASRCDTHIGVAVSGGLDSSALFSVAHLLKEKGTLLAPNIAGYSLAAEEGSNAFELPYARAAAAHVGRELTEVALFDPDIDWYTKDARWHCDIPIPCNGAMMLGMERQVVADGSRVLINGIGGDEWLQGSSQYCREYLAEFDLRSIWKALRRDSETVGWPNAVKQSLRQIGAELTPGPLRQSIRRRLREHRRRGDMALNWLSPELRSALKEAEEAYEQSMPDNAIQWAKHNLATSPFSDLSHSLMRRQRAAIGIESRHPMLSRAFIEFSLRTPADIKLRGGQTKLVHRNAMAGILPDVILNRATKANFTNAKIDTQCADYVRLNGPAQLAEICDLNGLKPLLDIDFSSPEGDFWGWEIWGLYASAAFLYQGNFVNEINPATGVQQDRI